MVINQLEDESKAHSLTQVADFAESLDQIKRDFNRMQVITNGLRVNASQLSDGNFVYIKILPHDNFIFIRSPWSQT